MHPSIGLMRKRPRPKMKASKGCALTPRPTVPQHLPIRSKPQTPRRSETRDASKLRGPSKGQRYDDPMICTFCDDGGKSILSCEGICHRHFHAKKENVADDSGCQTLGFSVEKLKNMSSFVCENCKHGMHQCFICGELGSSKGHQCEVYICHVESCKKFYHPQCIFRLRGIVQSTQYVIQIMMGTMKLFCPRHKCDTCKIEDMSPGSLVQCRRCPRAWHIDCLKDFENSGEIPTTEIWDHGKFKYIYCRNHEILQDLRTPKRDHVIFP